MHFVIEPYNLLTKKDFQFGNRYSSFLLKICTFFRLKKKKKIPTWPMWLMLHTLSLLTTLSTHHCLYHYWAMSIFPLGWKLLCFTTISSCVLNPYQFCPIYPQCPSAHLLLISCLYFAVCMFQSVLNKLILRLELPLRHFFFLFFILPKMWQHPWDSFPV